MIEKLAAVKSVSKDVFSLWAFTLKDSRTYISTNILPYVLYGPEDCLCENLIWVDALEKSIIESRKK